MPSQLVKHYFWVHLVKEFPGETPSASDSDLCQEPVHSPPTPPSRFAGLWPQTGCYVISSPGSEVFRPGLNLTIVSPQSSSWRQQSLGLLGLHSYMSRFLQEISLVYICVCMCLVAQSCLPLCDPTCCSQAPLFPGKILQARILEWVAMPSSKGILEGSNPGLLHCRWIPYHLNHQGSPRILEWGSLSLLQENFPTQGSTQVSCIIGGFFTSWAAREAHMCIYIYRESDTHTYVY